MAKTRETPAVKAARRRVEQVYNANCSGIQIDMMDIPRVFDVGLKAIAEGADDAVLQATIITFVESIRKN